MASVQYQNRQLATTVSIETEYRFHDEYDVKNENGDSIGVAILKLYYGDLWESAMDRLIHKIDGHLFSISYEGACYNVYRNVAQEENRVRNHLKLV